MKPDSPIETGESIQSIVLKNSNNGRKEHKRRLYFAVANIVANSFNEAVSLIAVAVKTIEHLDSEDQALVRSALGLSREFIRDLSNQLETSEIESAAAAIRTLKEVNTRTIHPILLQLQKSVDNF